MQTKTWVSHPLKEESKKKSTLLFLAILSVTLIAGWSFESVIFALLSLVLLTASMSHYFFSTHYNIDENGFTVSHLVTNRQYLWADFHRAVLHPDGIFLSPFAKPHRLDSFRGQFLKSSNPQEIYNAINQHIQTGSA